MLGTLVIEDPTDETDAKDIVDVGKLSEFCGQKFSKDIVQVSSYEIALPGSAAAMKDIIASIMQSEKEKESEQAAGVWRLRTNDEEGIFYSQGSAIFATLAALCRLCVPTCRNMLYVAIYVPPKTKFGLNLTLYLNCRR